MVCGREGTRTKPTAESLLLNPVRTWMDLCVRVCECAQWKKRIGGGKSSAAPAKRSVKSASTRAAGDGRWEEESVASFKEEGEDGKAH